MSNQIPSQYILQYEDEMRLAYQFGGSKLDGIVRKGTNMGAGASPADYVGPMLANDNPGRLAPTPNNNATAPDSIYKYLFAPIVQVDQVLKSKTLGNEIPFKFIVNFNEIAISNSTWTGTNGFSSTALSSATITVPPGVMYNWWTAIS